MRTRSALGLLVLCLFSPGCYLLCSATQNLLFEATQQTDEPSMHKRNYRLAEEYWEKLQSTHPGGEPSKDYADGFKDGFTDYLDRGERASPPPLPPPCYWTSRYQTPKGYQAIQDWYAGFQVGVAAGHASWHRPYEVVPPPGASPVPLEHWPGNAPPSQPDTDSLLPPPRRLMPPLTLEQDNQVSKTGYVLSEKEVAAVRNQGEKQEQNPVAAVWATVTGFSETPANSGEELGQKPGAWATVTGLSETPSKPGEESKGQPTAQGPRATVTGLTETPR